MNSFEEQIRRLWSLLTGGQPDDFTAQQWTKEIKEVWVGDETAKGKNEREIIADRVADITNAVTWLKDNKPQTFKPEYSDLREACHRAMRGRRKALVDDTTYDPMHVPPPRTQEQIETAQERTAKMFAFLQGQLSPEDYAEWLKEKGYYDTEAQGMIEQVLKGREVNKQYEKDLGKAEAEAELEAREVIPIPSELAYCTECHNLCEFEPEADGPLICQDCLVRLDEEK